MDTGEIKQVDVGLSVVSVIRKHCRKGMRTDSRRSALAGRCTFLRVDGENDGIRPAAGRGADSNYPIADGQKRRNAWGKDRRPADLLAQLGADGQDVGL